MSNKIRIFNELEDRKKVLVTGGSGFLGEILCRYLKEKGYIVYNLDKVRNADLDKEGFTTHVVDIRNKGDVEQYFKKSGPFEHIFHCAALLAYHIESDKEVWRTNVYGTENLVRAAVAGGSKSFMFISSNSIFGIPERNPVTELTKFVPLETYGKSKIAGEQVLKKYSRDINISIFRCPVIVARGRLGLVAIFFEFISENKNIYVLGNGNNKYQFIYADDLCDALLLGTKKEGYNIYGIGADDTPELKKLYESVINYSGGKSKVKRLPTFPVLQILNILHFLGLSPIGPYQAGVLGRSMYFDTSKIKRELGWKPKMSASEMLIENYEWYLKNKKNWKE